MATLKYKDSEGNYQPIVGVNVQNQVVQTTGQSTTAVMSQKAVSDLIPAQASASNQLADKDFVNSSITTATATYRGSYNLVSDLSLTTQASHGQIETALNTAATGADNNDYCFVQIPTADATPTEIASVERYKYNGTTWSYEYAINNSGFTAAQWAAVNSNITSGLVAQLNAFSNNSQTSISKLFGMDASGNFQNISTSDLASVLSAQGSYMFLESCYIEPVKIDVRAYAEVAFDMEAGILLAHFKSSGYVGIATVSTQSIDFIASNGIGGGSDAAIRVWKKSAYGQVYVTNNTSAAINSLYMWAFKYRYNNNDLIRKTLH